MNNSIRHIKAKELLVGDEILIRFSGGEEFVEIKDTWQENGLVYWYGQSLTIGAIEDHVELERDIRIKNVTYV